MPIQKEVLAGAIGVGAATFGCYYVYKQITRRYSLVESGGTENDASGSADFFESTEIIEQRTCNRSEGPLSDHHSVNPGSEPEQGTSCGTSRGDNCINSDASQSNEPADHGDVISPQIVLKKTNDLGDNHVSSHHVSLQDNHLTNSFNSRQLLDNRKFDCCSADPSPQKYACLNVKESVMPNNDKDMGKAYEFDVQKSDITEIKDVQEEINANQNQPDLTIDNEAHGHDGLERSISEILNVYDYSPTTTTPTDGSQYTHHRSRDSTSSLNSQTSIEMDVAPLGPGRMLVSIMREIGNEFHATIPDSINGEPFSPVNSMRYSDFSALHIREEETLLSSDTFQSSSQVPLEHNLEQSTPIQNSQPVHDIIQSQLVEVENLASHRSQPENQMISQPIQPCISSMNRPEPSPQLPTISTRTSLPPAGTTTCISDLNIENTTQNNFNDQNPITRTNDNNLDTEQGQSDNDQTVTESVLTNERTESTSEYCTMTSNSDNLSHNLDDNNIVTPEDPEVLHCRSDPNPECMPVTRMQSVPQLDAQPSNGADISITEQVETISDLDDEKDITDVVILHAEDDRLIALDFMNNMEAEFPELKLNLKIFEQLNVGRSMFESASLLFETCRFLFVLLTNKFARDDLPRFLNEIALVETITFKDRNCRLIPVLIDGDCRVPELGPIIPLMYNRYLEGKSRGIRDRGFINSFEKLVENGRKKYLTS
ncbi:uncharacterized protein LOC134699023 [Mytilus trossulus]|uniref:uncharacterized protein LOC134699023 n=1 Tax=Mytilus trossulus TaxID=6551 RepID=UPI0030060EE1